MYIPKAFLIQLCLQAPMPNRLVLKTELLISFHDTIYHIIQSAIQCYTHTESSSFYFTHFSAHSGSFISLTIRERQEITAECEPYSGVLFASQLFF